MKLGNRILAVHFDETTGCLCSLVDKRSRREHLPDRAEANLFRLIVPSDTWDGRYADASGQVCQAESSPGRVRLHYPSLKSADDETLAIAVTVDVTLAPDSPEVLLSMEVANNGDTPVIELLFPLVSGWTGYDGPGHDVITHAAEGTGGQLDPHGFPDDRAWSTFSLRHQRWASRHVLSPWLDLSGNTEGMWLANYMTSPRVGCLAVENAKGYRPGFALSIGWASTPEIRPGATWRSPAFGVGVHRGDWHETGRHYRRWLRTWWQPADVPDRLRRSFAMQNVVFRDFDGRPFRGFAELAEVARIGKKYGIDDLCVWDYFLLGTYARLHPGHLTEYPEEEWQALRESLADATADGCFVSMLINQRVVGQQSDFFQNGGKAGALRVRDGTIKQEPYPCSTYGAESSAYWRGPLSAIMCQRSREFREAVTEHLDRLLDVGFNAFFLDQPFEHLPCYADNHGHASVDDTHAAAVEWIGAFRNKLREKHPGGYIIGEFPDVFVGQVIDLHWNWFWHQGMPETVAFSMPGLLNSWVGFGDVARAQMAFLHGFNLMLVIDGLRGTLDDVPDYADYVRRLGDLRRRTAHCTTLAQFEDNVGLSCNDVLAKRFSTGDGDAVTLVNPRNEPVRGTVEVASLTGAGPASRLHRLDGSTEAAGTVDGDTASLACDLAPHDVAVWEIGGCMTLRDRGTHGNEPRP